jgi:hypothetical protein
MVHIILVIYDQKNKILDYRKIFDKIFTRYNLIIINNGSDSIEKAVVGTNQFREFSAYHQGYECIKNTIKNDEIIAFINDTFMERRNFNGYFLYAFKLFYILCLYKLIKGKFIVGEIHSMGERIFISTEVLKEHISTYFFITNKNTIEKINIDFMIQDIDLWFNTDLNSFKSKILSREYLSRLNNWLIRNPSEKKQWYRCAEVTDKNIKILELKAKSIYKEHYLSFLASKNCVKLIGIYSRKKYTISRILLYILNKL